MQEIFKKIKERLEREVEYQSSKADAAGKTCAFEEITVVKAREKMAECYEHAIEIVNQVAEEYGTDINVGSNEFCEWFKYDYRTIAPKNHDVGNPYWRIPEDYGKLMFCPYCGKKTKVVE